MKLIQKHRIYPNKHQKDYLAKQFGCCRFVWNYFVASHDKIGYWFTYNEMSAELTGVVKPANRFLYEVPAQCLQQTLRDLAKASRNKQHPPKFKKKHWRQSCRYGQYTKVDRDNNLLYLPRMMNKPIKIILERDLPEYTMCTIVKESDDRYYACFWIEKEEVTHIKNKDLIHTGIDLGIKDLIVTSEGEKYKASKLFNRSEKSIKRKNIALAKKIKGSRRWLKCRRRLSRVQAKVRRQRMDHVHKLTTNIASDDTVQGIAIESLNIKSMLQNRKLSKSISDASWYLFVKTLKYKLEMRGKVLTQVSRFYPSTKTCSACNHVLDTISLKTREWTCPACGTHHDRDINAAINLANEGDRIYHYKPTGTRIA